MPNIEIHGYGFFPGFLAEFEFPGSRASAIKELVNRLIVLFSNAEYRDDIVVTVMSDGVVNLCGVSQPFIRLVSTAQDYVPDVLDKLKTLGVDVEHQVLAAFHEAPGGGITV